MASAFCFDDSPVKKNLTALMTELGGVSDIEVYRMDSAPLDVSFPQGMNVGDGSRVVSMKKRGMGTKNLKQWMEDTGCYSGEGKEFWKEQYEIWSVFKPMCDPKTLAAHDLLDTLIMRLSFHLRKPDLLKLLKSKNIVFGPFRQQPYDLSYYAIVLHLLDIESDSKTDRSIEKRWCEYVLAVAVVEYFAEIGAMGWDKPVDSKTFEEEVFLYIKTLRTGLNRNASAHIFSSSIKQVWTTKGVKIKNRCLTDVPEKIVNDEYKRSLVAALDLLTSKPPESLSVLKLVLPMHAFFLKKVLEKPGEMKTLEPSELPKDPPPAPPNASVPPTKKPRVYM